MIGLEHALIVSRIPQTELASLLGIKKQNITLWTRQKQKISKKHLPTISKLLGLTPELLQKEFNESDELEMQIANVKRLAGALGIRCDIKISYKRDD